MTASFLIFLLQLAGTPVDEFPSPGWESDRTRELVLPYWNCVIEHSEKFERSGEAADVIASASMRARRDEQVNLHVSFLVDSVKAEEAGEREVENGLVKASLDRFDKIIISAAILRVVEVRTDNSRTVK